MRNKRLFLSVISFTLGATSVYSSEEITALLQTEMKKAKENIQLEVESANKKLEALRGARDKAESTSKKLAEGEQSGVELLKSYAVLINTRYVNAKGEYQSGHELGAKDQDYLNRLFSKYLRCQPLVGKVSTGEAVRVINWGVAQLGDLIHSHNSPSASNNSELEMIAAQTRELEASILRNTELAKKLGVDLTKASGDDREPASDKDKEDKGKDKDD